MMQTNLPMSEEARQARIDWLALHMQAETSVAKRRIYWEEMRELIKGRTKETVARLEQEKGLRP